MNQSGRAAALESIDSYFDAGSFFDDLSQRVGFRTESPVPEQRGELYRYQHEQMVPAFEAMGFHCQVSDNPVEGGGPFLVARRHEADHLPTVMSYAHGDVVRGYDDQWDDGLNPWELTARGDRLYGRGTADNKGQHTINLAALQNVLQAKGHLGFNSVFLVETGEELGSPGLKEFCAANKALLAADVFIASDGPRMQAHTPTIFMGSRQVFNFTMTLNLRDGGHHSGNWGGLLTNPGIVMANAIASMVDAKGRIQIDGWQAPRMSESVRAAIGRLKVGGDPGAPEIDPNWGEPDLTPEERVFGSNTFEIRAFETGNPRNPVNAIPPRAVAHGHLRYVAGTDQDTLLPALRKHLDRNGFSAVELDAERATPPATRLDPSHPWAQWVIDSMSRTSESEVAVLPNLGGTLPNEIFALDLGLPTIWIPHSYAGCSQHAPNEHMLAPVCREALRIMTGLWWDLGEGNCPTKEVS